MGFLYCLLGLGAYYEMLLYLIIHAFVKIYLFLVGGAIILYCGGCQDIRWMGGLLCYAPWLWVAYLVGAIGMAGLPYWSGYYCKSSSWLALCYGGTYWGGIRIAILLSSLLTNVYLVRLGYLIFGGHRGGHRSIYRLRWVSALTCVLISSLGLVVAFCGITWERLLDGCTHAWRSGFSGDLLHYYRTFLSTTIWGWSAMHFLYSTLVYLTYLALLRRLSAHFFISSWYAYYIVLILVIIAYST